MTAETAGFIARWGPEGIVEEARFRKELEALLAAARLAARGAIAARFEAQAAREEQPDSLGGANPVRGAELRAVAAEIREVEV